jgi:hypothetical protein
VIFLCYSHLFVGGQATEEQQLSPSQLSTQLSHCAAEELSTFRKPEAAQAFGLVAVRENNSRKRQKYFQSSEDAFLGSVSKCCRTW